MSVLLLQQNMQKEVCNQMLTKLQEQAVYATNSCVVAAGAGSGKTRVLSERFVHLIKQGYADCDQILTITFTKKATAEMKERIHAVLLKENLSDQLRLFPNAWISTVDSFCSEVARTDCYKYGFSSAFSMLDEDEFKQQVRRIALKVLEKKENKQFASKLLKYANVDTVLNMMESLASSFNIVHEINPQEEASYVCEQLKNTLKGSVDLLVCSIDEYINTAEGCESLLKDCLMLKDAKERLDSDIFSAVSMINISRAYGSVEIKDEILRIKKDINGLKESIVLLAASVSEEAFVSDFYQVISQFEKAVSDCKKSVNSLSFSDVMQIAIDILTNNKDIRKRFKNLFKFVMIDEFQDNNDDYRKILFLLCEKTGEEKDGIPGPEDLEEGKIFLVGDEKQSIYRFRGADVSVFKRMSSLIQLSGGQLIKLSQNFRSEPDLVRFFNILFTNVMKNNVFDYEAGFENLDGRDPRQVTPRIIFHNYVHPYKDNPKEDENGNVLCSAIQAEAYSVANLIKRMVSTDDFIICRDKEQPRRPRYNEIAILFKSLTHQGEFEKALRLSGIPYSVAQARATFQEAVINDFYSLLNLAIYPYDKVSEIAVENSPFGGKESALELAQIIRKKASEGSIAQVLDFMYYKLAYRQYLIANPANQVYEEHYSWLFSLAEEFDRNNWDLVKFLDYLRPLLGTQNQSRELTVQREENLGVQIMTIHKSKGLEFPIVIVASMDSGSGGGFGDTIEYINSDHLYLPVIPSATGHLKNLMQVINSDGEVNQEEAELKRVFYVAATRAENHLIFSCQIKVTQKKSEKDSSVCKSLADLFVKATGFSPETETFTDSAFNCIENLKYAPVPLELTLSKQHLDYSKIPTNRIWYYSCKEQSFDFSNQTVGVTSLIEEERFAIGEETEKEVLPKIKSDQFIRSQDLRTEFGTSVHALIESAVTGENYQIPKNKNLSDEQFMQFCSDAQMLADRFIESEQFKNLQKTYESIVSELRFQLFDVDSDKIVEGSMDMVCENKDSVLVIDFKTDLYKCPEEHKAQLSWYERAAKSLFPGKKIQTQVVYLRENK